MATFNPECMDGQGGFGCIGSLEHPDTFNVIKLSIIIPAASCCLHLLYAHFPPTSLFAGMPMVWHWGTK
jgi:hypothetical protein